MEQKISLTPYVVRFTWVYAAFSIAAIVIVNLLQMSSNTGLAVGILMASAIATGQKFVTEHKRVLHTSEKLRMAFYSLIVAILLSAILVVGVLSLEKIGVEAFLREFIGAFSSLLITGVVALIVLINFMTLYFAYGFVLNRIYKGMVKRGEI